jgi:hypothetical protein
MFEAAIHSKSKYTYKGHTKHEFLITLFAARLLVSTPKRGLFTQFGSWHWRCLSLAVAVLLGGGNLEPSA